MNTAATKKTKPHTYDIGLSAASERITALTINGRNMKLNVRTVKGREMIPWKRNARVRIVAMMGSTSTTLVSVLVPKTTARVSFPVDLSKSTYLSSWANRKDAATRNGTNEIANT